LSRKHPRLRLEIVSSSPTAQYGYGAADVTLRVERPTVGGFWIELRICVHMELLGQARIAEVIQFLGKTLGAAK